MVENVVALIFLLEKITPNIYNRCYEPRSPLYSPKEGQPPKAETGPIGANCHGAVFRGARLVYGPEAEARRAGGVLPVGLHPGGESASLCSQRRGGVLAETGLGVAEVYQGHGLLGEGEQGDRTRIETDREAPV